MEKDTMKQKSSCQKNEHFKSCCCDCINRVNLIDNEASDMPSVGYGCSVFFEDDKIIMTGDFEHGLCEMWQPKKTLTACSFLTCPYSENNVCNKGCVHPKSKKPAPE